MTINNIFIYFCSFILLWIFIQNLSTNVSISLLVLLFLVVLFLFFIFITKKYFLVCFLSIIWFLLWIFVSYLNLENINNNNELLNTFLDKQSHNIELEILDIKSISNDNITYIWKINKIDTTFIKEKILIQVIIKSINKIDIWTNIKTKTKLYIFRNTQAFKLKDYMLSKSIYFKIYPYTYKTVSKSKLKYIKN